MIRKLHAILVSDDGSNDRSNLLLACHFVTRNGALFLLMGVGPVGEWRLHPSRLVASPSGVSCVNAVAPFSGGVRSSRLACAQKHLVFFMQSGSEEDL